MGRRHTKTVVVVVVVEVVVVVADSATGVPVIVVEGTATQRTAFNRSALSPEGDLIIIRQTSEFFKNSEVSF